MSVTNLLYWLTFIPVEYGYDIKLDSQGNWKDKLYASIIRISYMLQIQW